MRNPLFGVEKKGLPLVKVLVGAPPRSIKGPSCLLRNTLCMFPLR